MENNKTLWKLKLIREWNYYRIIGQIKVAFPFGKFWQINVKELSHTKFNPLQNQFKIEPLSSVPACTVDFRGLRHFRGNTFLSKLKPIDKFLRTKPAKLIFCSHPS